MKKINNTYDENDEDNDASITRTVVQALIEWPFFLFTSGKNSPGIFSFVLLLWLIDKSDKSH